MNKKLFTIVCGVFLAVFASPIFLDRVANQGACRGSSSCAD